MITCERRLQSHAKAPAFSSAFACNRARVRLQAILRTWCSSKPRTAHVSCCPGGQCMYRHGVDRGPSMDPLQVLSAGVVYGRRSGSRVHFVEASSGWDAAGEQRPVSLNFFGEPETSSSDDKSSPSSRATQKRQRRQCDVNAPTTSDDAPAAEPLASPVDVEAYRRKQKIYTFTRSSTRRDRGIGGGAAVPAPVRSFRELQTVYGVQRWIVDNVENLFKFAEPTPIQKQAIPCILTGQPLLASAPTGSGKTVAFLLPIISLLKAPAKRLLRALVIVPSRELGVQIVQEFDVLRGHKNFRCQLLNKLQAGHEHRRLDVGVSTPLKLCQLLRDGDACLREVKHLVLDEADKLLDMGFAPQIDEILSHVTLDSTQLIFFSATLPEGVVRLVESVCAGATRIAVGEPMAAAEEIEQSLLFVTHEEGKLTSFRQLLANGAIRPPALVFVQSIDRAKELFRELVFDGVFVDVIHAERSKRERDRVVKAFREKKIWILISTDLMSRGVDFPGVRMVVNWDLPQSAAAYIHRIGRTGRAMRAGKAITFFTLSDVQYLPPIVTVMRQSGVDVPQWMLNLKKPTREEKRSFAKKAVRRKRISTDPSRKTTKRKAKCPKPKRRVAPSSGSTL